jgi:hypothetical protein
MSAEEKTCFVIGPIGGDDSEIRSHWAAWIADVIEDVLLRNGYSMRTPLTLSSPTSITDDIVELLAECPLVVANLTGANPNVYFELALRYAAGKPVIPMLKKPEEPPFDIKDMRLIYYSLDSPEDRKSARDSLERAIQAVVKSPLAAKENFVVRKIRLMDVSKNEQDTPMQQIQRSLSLHEGLLTEIGTSLKGLDAPGLRGELTTVVELLGKRQNSESGTLKNIGKLTGHVTAMANRVSDLADKIQSMAQAAKVETTTKPKVDNIPLHESHASSGEGARDLILTIKTIKATSPAIWKKIAELGRTWDALDSATKTSKAGAYREDLRIMMGDAGGLGDEILTHFESFEDPASLLDAIANAVRMMNI